MSGALTGLATTTLALTAFASTTLAVLIFPRRRVAPIARVQTAICWACALASLLLLPFDLGLGGSNSSPLRVFWHATHWDVLENTALAAANDAAQKARRATERAAARNLSSTRLEGRRCLDAASAGAQQPRRAR